MEPLGRGRALDRSRLRLQRSAHRCRHRATSSARASSASAAASGQESPAGILLPGAGRQSGRGAVAGPRPGSAGGSGGGPGGCQTRGPGAPRLRCRRRVLRGWPCRLLPARPRSPPAAGSSLGHIYIDIGHLHPIHLRNDVSAAYLSSAAKCGDWSGRTGDKDRGARGRGRGSPPLLRAGGPAPLSRPPLAPRPDGTALPVAALPVPAAPASRRDGGPSALGTPSAPPEPSQNIHPQAGPSRRPGKEASRVPGSPVRGAPQPRSAGPTAPDGSGRQGGCRSPPPPGAPPAPGVNHRRAGTCTGHNETTSEVRSRA